MAGADKPEVVILDDAFQHRRVRPSLSLLLIDYRRPLHRDHLLPWGRLRDTRSQLRRADIIIITKCPACLTPEKQQEIAQHLPERLRRQLFFTTFAYGAPQPVFSIQSAVGSGQSAVAVGSSGQPAVSSRQSAVAVGSKQPTVGSQQQSGSSNYTAGDSPLLTATADCDCNCDCLLQLPTATADCDCQLPTATAYCILLTGIAHPAPLVQYLQEQLRPPIQRLHFSDHHLFTPSDVRKINAAARRHPDAPLFTTEKDAMRLRETAGLAEDVKQRLFFLPVTVRFLTDECTPTPEGALKQQESFKKIITSRL
jgi:tetraacyldisaccharide-1-P 4'-kinase